MRVKDAVGRFGEDVAVRHLETAGFTVLERNWRCRSGELDVIATDGAELVFVEVKTRSTVLFGAVVEAVDAAKAARLRRIAAAWLTAHPHVPTSWTSLRFDVVGVHRLPGRVDVQHVRGAF